MSQNDLINAMRNRMIAQQMAEKGDRMRNQGQDYESLGISKNNPDGTVTPPPGHEQWKIIKPPVGKPFTPGEMEYWKLIEPFLGS